MASGSLLKQLKMYFGVPFEGQWKNMRWRNRAKITDEPITGKRYKLDYYRHDALHFSHVFQQLNNALWNYERDLFSCSIITCRVHACAKEEELPQLSGLPICARRGFYTAPPPPRFLPSWLLWEVGSFLSVSTTQWQQHLVIHSDGLATFPTLKIFLMPIYSSAPEVFWKSDVFSSLFT